MSVRPVFPDVKKKFGNLHHDSSEPACISFEDNYLQIACNFVHTESASEYQAPDGNGGYGADHHQLGDENSIRTILLPTMQLSSIYPKLSHHVMGARVKSIGNSPTHIALHKVWG